MYPAAEALNGLPRIDQLETRTTRSALAASIGQTYVSKWTEELGLGAAIDSIETATEMDIYLMAKTLFDLKEYDRVASTLKDCKSPKSIFLRLYSKYLAGERRREQESRDVLGPMDTSMVINRELDKVDAELSEIYQTGTMDSFCKYLYAVVLTKRNRKQLAASILVESVKQYPYNWSAWLQLSACVPSHEALTNIMPELPVNFMREMFLLHVGMETFNGEEEFEVRLQELSRTFPRSAYMMEQRALALYHAREFPASEEIFEVLTKENPHRLDNLDVFSNLLYVTDNRTKLSYLAHNYNHRDYRAWNGLGQTYEVLKMHYYALGYYQRATALRPYDGRMWCAMAECYESLGQDLAAIKCYTRALLGADKEKVALRKLPKLYKKIGNTEAAAHYFRKSYEQRREEDEDSEDASEACIFLALYERSKGNWQLAHDYAAEAMNLSSGVRAYLANLLAGPLENRQWGSLSEQAYAASPGKVGSTSSGGDDSSDNVNDSLYADFNQRSQPKQLSEQKPVAVDANAGIEATASQPEGRKDSPAPIEFIPPRNPDGTLIDCSSQRSALEETVARLARIVPQISQAYPAFQPMMSDLRLLTAEMPARDSSLEEKADRYQTMAFGIVGFNRIVPYLSDKARIILQPVIDILNAMAIRLHDVRQCTTGLDNSAFSGPSPPFETSNQLVGCKVVQRYYENLLEETTTAASSIDTIFRTNHHIEKALDALRFHSAGAFLSDQGALEAIQQIPVKEGEQPELEDLVMMMQLTLSAGDALQACQRSHAIKAIEQEASILGVHQYEQDIYGHLGIHSRSKDPTGSGSHPSSDGSSPSHPPQLSIDDTESSPPSAAEFTGSLLYPGCERDYQDLIESVNTILETIVTGPHPSDTAPKMAENILERFFRLLKSHMENYSTQADLDANLRQLDIVTAQLVRTIKRVPANNPFVAMQRYLEPLTSIESHLSQLYTCAINTVQDKTKATSSQSSNGRQKIVRCDVTADLYRIILQTILSEVDKALKNDQDRSQEYSSAMNLFRSRVILLARTAGLWNEDLHGLEPEINNDASSTWQDGKPTEVSSLLGDDLVARLKAATVGDDDGSSGAAITGIVDTIPLIQVGANMLEACLNVQRATSGADSSVKKKSGNDGVAEESVKENTENESENDSFHYATEDDEDGDPVMESDSDMSLPTPKDDILEEVHSNAKRADEEANQDNEKMTNLLQGMVNDLNKTTSSVFSAISKAVQSGISYAISLVGWTVGMDQPNGEPLDNNTSGMIVATNAVDVVDVPTDAVNEVPDATTATTTATTTTTAVVPDMTDVPMPKGDCTVPMLKLGDAVAQFRGFVMRLRSVDEQLYTDLSWEAFAVERLSREMVARGARRAKYYLDAIMINFRTALNSLRIAKGRIPDPAQYDTFLHILMAMYESSRNARRCFETPIEQQNVAESVGQVFGDEGSHHNQDHGTEIEVIEDEDDDEDFYSENSNEDDIVGEEEEEEQDQDANGDSNAEGKEAQKVPTSLKRDPCLVLGSVVDDALQWNRNLWTHAVKEAKSKESAAADRKEDSTKAQHQDLIWKKAVLKSIEAFAHNIDQAQYTPSSSRLIDWSRVDLDGLNDQFVPIKDDEEWVPENRRLTNAYMALDDLAHVLEECRAVDVEQEVEN
ncbi:Anaphase-promoting complex subunit 23 [Actinomortierella wolfii]|nr:Anaphase-promoting complex subunit 23 [Actinomortierella wolfii]